MLVRLTPNYVSDQWELYGSMIEQSLIPYVGTNDLIMTKVLHKILDGKLIVWVHTDEKDNPTSVLTTVVYEEPITEVRALLIYSAFGADNANKNVIQDAIMKLRQFAKAKGCDSVIAYSNVRSVIEFCKVTGGNPEFSLLTWSVV